MFPQHDACRAHSRISLRPTFTFLSSKYTQLGWPDGWELGKGWELEQNKCEWCPATGNRCGEHLQSPINLQREVGDKSDRQHLECFDAHWIAYEDGGCDWEDMINNPWAPNRNAFQIRRHALQIVQPVDEQKGILQCQAKGRKFPRLDYPKGFPKWWHLSHTEITTPSEHSQHGRFYDAEVHLAHFYESNDGELHNDMGKVVIFLDGVKGQSRWSFLDKLICQWREVEDQVRKDCDLPYEVPDYPGCRNDAAPAPSPPPKAPFADPYPWIDCDTVENPKRMCKPSSCCEEDALFTRYCSSVYEEYKDTIGSICWHCCPGKIVDPQVAPTNLQPIGASPPAPTPRPAREPEKDPVAPVPAPKDDFSCKDYPSIDFKDMCRNACVSPRCSSNTCHAFYETFKDNMEQACSTCCRSSRSVAPAPPIHPEIPQYDCRDVAPFGNPYRICKDTSCCNPKRNNNKYCRREVYNVFGDDIFGICWYCCSTPKLAEGAPEFSRRSMLRSSSNTTLLYKWETLVEEEEEEDKHAVDHPLLPDEEEEEPLPEVQVQDYSSIEKLDDSDAAGNYFEEVDPMKYIHNIELSDEDYRPNMSEEDFAAELEEYQRQRAIEKASEEEHGHRRLVNYDNVKWSDYAWMREVGTEYYFRYEGSQAVPPCYEKAHYRVMKDYIRVHPSQIEELERLIAQRIAPKNSEKRSCRPDTAGKARGRSNGKAVDVNRPLQSTTEKHKNTFCECKDWKSKFGSDREWCEMSTRKRFYDQPYNFDTDDF